MLALAVFAIAVASACTPPREEPGVYQMLYAAEGEPEGTINRILTNAKSDTGMGTGDDLFVAHGGEWAVHTLIHSNDNPDIRLLETNGKESFLLELTPDVAESLPTLTTDGTRVAWVSENTVDGSVQIMTALAGENAAGESIFTVEAPFFVAHRPVFNADGTQLAVLLSFTENGVDYTRLELIEVNGSGSDALTSTNQILSSPHFSSDGLRLYFVNIGDNKLETMRLDDKGVEAVTDELAAYDHLAVSGDDGRIAFAVAEGDSGMQVYSMNMDGSEKVKLSDRAGMTVSAVDISHDGLFVAWYAFDPTDETAADNKVLLARDSAGTGEEGIFTVKNGVTVSGFGFAQ
jgi:hypothetical protein